MREKRENSVLPPDAPKLHLDPLKTYPLPSHTRRRIEFSFRTSWNTFLCIGLTYLAPWSPYALYLAPCVSVISTVMQFGLWLENAFKIVVACIVGGIIGCLIGASYKIRILHLILLFLSMTWANSCSVWDRTGIIFATLSIMICALLPIYSDGKLQGVYLFYVNLAILALPYLITGATLLFPWPALAIFTARSKTLIICRKISLMINALIKAFNQYEYCDLYCAEFDQLLSEVDTDFEDLKMQARLIKSEKIFFPNVIHMPESLDIFNKIVHKVIQDLVGLKDMVRKIAHNKTQEKFVEVMSIHLEDINKELEILLIIIGEYIDTFHPISYEYYQYTRKCYYQWKSYLFCSDKIKKSSHEPRVKKIYQVPNSRDLIEYQRSMSHYEDYHSLRDSERLRSDKNNSNSNSNSSNNDQERMHNDKSHNDENHDGTSNTNNNHTHNHSHNHHSVNISNRYSLQAYTSQDDCNNNNDNNDNNHNNDSNDDIEEGKDSGKKSANNYQKTRNSFTKRQSSGQLIYNYLINKANTHETLTIHELKHEFNESVERLYKMRSNLLDSFGEGRKMFMFRPEATTAAPITNNNHYTNSTTIHMHDTLQHLHNTTTTNTAHSANTIQMEDEQLNILHKNLQLERNQPNLVQLSVYEENIRLSIKNLAPRAAYLHRISSIVELMSSLQQVFEEKGNYWSPSLFIKQCALGVFAYIHKFITSNITELAVLYRTLTGTEASTPATTATAQTVTTDLNGSSKDYSISSKSKNTVAFKERLYNTLDRLYVDFKTYMQPMKIAAAVTIMASFVIFRPVEALYGNGLWGVAVVCLIRQDTTSSSFLTGYQRIEGTVIGAIYSFIIFRIFDCDNNTCGPDLVIPVLVIWLSICALFREGPRHGYAATVAGFTPIILFMGYTRGLTGAWNRIEETFLGTAVYLIIDNVVFPNRTKDVIKNSVLTCINESRLMFHDAVSAIQELVKLESTASSTTTPVVHSRQQRTSTQVSATSVTSNAHTSIINNNNHATNDDKEIELSVKINNNGQINIESDDTTNNAMTLSSLPSLKLTLPTDLNSHQLQYNRENIEEIYQVCTKHLNNVELHLNKLGGDIAKQSAQLKLVVHEPELWYRSFPTQGYDNLLKCFQSVHRSGYCVLTGTKALSVVIYQMVEKEENTSQHLSLFMFMGKHLFIISEKAERALTQAHSALKNLYENDDFTAPLTDIVTLSRSCESYLKAIDEHFRTVYIKQPKEVLIALNPYFIVAWQNVFESMLDLIKNLSDLGMTLHSIRNVEALMKI